MEWSTIKCYNIDEPSRYYAKWKNTDTKGHILPDLIYMKYPEQVKSRETITRWVATKGLWGGRLGNNCPKISFWGDDNVVE